MAQLFPANFDCTQLELSEQRVVSRFMEQLDDAWIVIPKVLITVEGMDREIDVVLVNFDQGIALVEVKGGIVTMREGQWRQYDRPMKDPAEQVMSAKYALIARLKQTSARLSGIELRHFVAFPDIVDFPDDGGGPNCPRNIVLTARELSSSTALAQALAYDGRRIPRRRVETILRALRTDVSEIEVSGRRVEGSSQRILAVSDDRLGPVIGLDENLRVHLRGGAGTGKTFVATRWARRALLRRESTMYVCYNRLLGLEMARRLDDISAEIENSPTIVAGTFHQIVLNLLGEDAPVVPVDAPQHWWDDHLPRLLLDRLDVSTARFDTIVVDEAQDFRPLWFEVLQRLMRDPETSRFYVLADAKQEIYANGWQPPTGFTRLELTHNVRNSSRIGAVVQSLGGAPVARGASLGPEVSLHRVGGAKEMVKSVRKSLELATDELGIPRSHLMVLTTHREVRDQLISALGQEWGLARWDGRDDDAIACETVHRTKGLERAGVVVVDMDENPDRTLFYVGCSRATSFLSVVGRDPLIEMARNQSAGG